MRLRFARDSTVSASPPPGLTSYKASLLAVVFLQLTFQASTGKIFEPEGQFEIIVPAAGEWPPTMMAVALSVCQIFTFAWKPRRMVG